MSGTHSPTTPLSDSNYEDNHRARTTRTVAIIKSHALEHRLNIERRIEEASFEIVKERQMEFAPDSDKEFLYELFGGDANSLFEGPVWIYVLERRRAVEVWNALMGDTDPERARETSPNALRALYGIDSTQNALMGSPDAQTAEDQIACLFQSSPPFAAQDLSFDGVELDNVEHELGVGIDGPAPLTESVEWRDRVGGFVSATNGGGTPGSGSRRGPSSVTSGGSGSRNGANGKGATVPFKARPMPRTTLVPDIAPRTTRAAALRAGIPVEPTKGGKPRAVPTKEELKQVFLDVPGHKRSSTIQVASTAPPTVAPRMTRAASLRINGGKAPQPARPKPRPTTSSGSVSGGSMNGRANGNTFEGVPGHKRRETISVASVAPPNVTPRLNKSAELRAKKDKAPPSSFMFKGPSTPKTLGLSRNASQSSLSPTRPASSAGTRPSSSMANLRASMSNGRASVARMNSLTNGTASNENDAPATVLKTPARPPSIEPRSNRSALLRAMKQNAAATPGVKVSAKVTSGRAV